VSAGPAPARLAEVRQLLERATRGTEHLAAPARRPATPERVDTLPVADPLAGLLSDGGLRKGSTVSVGSSTALLLALTATASKAGAWCALVGMPDVGLVAADEAGIVLERLAMVPDPGAELVAVTSALVDGLEVVVVGEGRARRFAPGDRQRLAARARESAAVLIAHGGGWPGADLTLDLAPRAGRWEGLCGVGLGRFRARQVVVRVGGRGRAGRGRVGAVLLPGPDGSLASAEQPSVIPPAATSTG
jgi:hypothetical protein